MRSLRRAPVLAAALATALTTLLAGPAAAHVTLHSTDATQGGSDALVSIRVPNEEDKATTTGLEIDFPSTNPLIGVLVQPTAGWTFVATTTKLPTPVTTDDGTITDYISKVVWSGGSVPVGGYQDFNIDVSTLPKAATVTVKALQTYSNGDVVRWIDPPAPAGQPMAAHPAPTLELAAAQDSSTTATTAAPGSAPTVSLKGLAKTSDLNGTKTLAIIALVIGIVALIASAVFMRLRRT